MAVVKMSLDKRGLLDYAAMGRDAVKDLKQSMRAVVNAGRQMGRSLMTSQFRRRTGRTAKETRNIRVAIKASTAEVSGSVGPMPNLTNIFEKGATVPSRQIEPRKGVALKFQANGGDVFLRGKTLVKGFTLAPRPVKEPTLKKMFDVGSQKVDELMKDIADR